MSLLDKFQSLDDETFEELVKEARSLIPQYSHDQWTDHNIHDPGITFIELFAWLAEMQIYQLNRVTDANYKKFLKLVGLYPYDAQPSRVDITFKDIKHEKKIEKGRQVFAWADTEKIIFETEEDINLLPLSLKSVITTYDSIIIDNTDANEKENIFFAAFGEKPRVGAALELGFDKILPEKEMQITVILYEKDLPPLDTSGGEPVPSASVVWEYFNGKDLNREKWNTLNVKKDTTLALTRSGRVVFDVPSSVKRRNKYYWIRCRLAGGSYEIAPLVDRMLINTVSAVQIETIQNEMLGEGLGIPEQKVWLKRKPIMRRTAPDSSFFSMGDILDWHGLLKTIKSQAKSIKPSPGKRIWSLFDQRTQDLISEWDEDQIPSSELKKSALFALNKVLESRGMYAAGPFEEIKIPPELKNLIENLEIITDTELRALNRFLIESAYPDKIKDYLVIQVQEKNGKWETWIEVDDFESSGPRDLHYVFDPDKGEVTFGNGLNGRIPPEKCGIRALLYKITQGSRGNIPRGQKFSIEMEEFDGENLVEASGGRDAESIDYAKARARMDFNATTRAVTSEDYEILALSTPGLRVARAKAIPDYNHDYPCTNIPGSVTVVVVPYSREGKTISKPGTGFIQTISKYLDLHRLITADLYVIGPEYVQVSVLCRINIKKGFGPSGVEKRVKDALAAFLDPLKGGPQGSGWIFGRAVYPSEIYQIIENVEGVEYATGVSLSAESSNGQYKREGDTIKISPVALVCSGEHRVITTDTRLEYVKISVACKVHVDEKTNPVEIKGSIKKELERFLDPLRGGPDRKGWHPGYPVDPSEIHKIIRKIDGVDRITSILLCAEGQQYYQAAVKIPEGALVVSGEHKVEII